MNENKKMTAAISAVMSYLQEESAAVSMQAAPDNIEPAARVASAAPVSFWGVSGRQDQMQMRNMMQLKAFHRLR